MSDTTTNKLELSLGIQKPENVTQEQIQAAYALNLCSVSVSQIIDYNDIYILEQEYESILNNLNLEHMPKDEALLEIIKRLLETITFFRIQEGDKAFIEKDYQQKMKNAIWSAMPNPGALVGAGLSGGGIGLAVAGLGAAIYCLSRGKIKTNGPVANDLEKLLQEKLVKSKLPEHIEFENAKTIEDARKFTKEVC